MSSKPDPRIASTTLTGGPADLIGHDLVIVDQFTYKGRQVHVPRPLAGVPEFVAVAEAEVKADELRRELMGTLADQGPARWQPDTTLVVEMRAAAESAVVTAVVGLEAFSNHHVSRLAEAQGGKVTVGSKQMKLEKVRELPLDDRYKVVLPALLGVPAPGREKWWQVLRRVQGLAALTRRAVHEPTKRSGLSGRRSLADFYLGEYQGATRMMFSVFEHYSPGWIGDERLRAIGDMPRSMVEQALEGLAQGALSEAASS